MVRSHANKKRKARRVHSSLITVWRELKTSKIHEEGVVEVTRDDAHNNKYDTLYKRVIFIEVKHFKITIDWHNGCHPHRLTPKFMKNKHFI